MSILRINVDNSAERWESKDGIYVHYSTHVAEMEKLRESVRRLVGEWEKEAERQAELNLHGWPPSRRKLAGIKSDWITEHARELSALIDGKDSNQEKS